MSTDSIAAHLKTKIKKNLVVIKNVKKKNIYHKYTRQAFHA
jgi:hypothetical protein